MSKILNLTLSPLTPSIDEACGLNFQIHAPYSDKNVTLLINPNITDYIEKKKESGVEISQFTFSEHTVDSKIIELNFSDKNEQLVDGIKVKLIDIKKVKVSVIDNQEFLSFEIFVSENS